MAVNTRDISEWLDEFVIGEDVETLQEQVNILRTICANLLTQQPNFAFHNNAHDGILYTDAAYRVTYANPRFLEMMKIQNDADLLGKPLPNSMWYNVNEATALLRDVETLGFVHERELNLYNCNNEPVATFCSSIAKRDEQGKFVGMEIMLRDATQNRKIQAELSRRSRVLERTSIFTRESLNGLVDLIHRNTSSKEILDLLYGLQKQLDDATM